MAKVNSLVLDLGNQVSLELVHIPAGSFLMGSHNKADRFAGKDEQPQHQVHLDEYWMGKYPVTNAQYRRFVSETGYTPPKHWFQAHPDLDENNYPVENINWFDARAFCYWLSRKSERWVCIPTEAEWEKAARGTDGRIWPWGNDKPDARDFEVRHSNDKQAIGLYSPATDSPYGCVDMATNVSELCNTVSSKTFRYPYVMNDGRENFHSRHNRVLRGGGVNYFLDIKEMRCAYRKWIAPDTPLERMGFRVIVTSAPVRWQIAFPDEGEKTDLEARLNLYRLNIANSTEETATLPEPEVQGYDILGLTWNFSGVYVRGDRLTAVEELLPLLQHNHPKLQHKTELTFSSDLPGALVMRLSKLSGKDRAVGEWLLNYFSTSGWQKFDPTVERNLTLQQQFGMKPIPQPEKDWIWLAKARY